MSRTLLQIVLRHADGLAPADGPDSALLRRFATDGDEAAFATLVKRHGPMVWAVCRQSVPNTADAEDAFQATFLVLVRSAAKIRTPDHLAGWLHAAAVRVSAMARRTFLRRQARERATARSEADRPVSAAAWGELLAAVHAEVASLPPSLRAAFVLCDLEGMDHAAAAERLGVKWSTLTGQLARARQRLMKALARRGVVAGAVAVGAAGVMPESLAQRVSGGAVPSAAVAELASEVTAMATGKLKLLTAGLLVVGGLALTGLGLLPRADGQNVRPHSGGVPLAPPTGSDSAGSGSGGPLSSTSGSRAAVEFLFVAKPHTLPEVATVLPAKAAEGWEYTGSLDVDPTDPAKLPVKTAAKFEGITKDTRVVLVFKRTAGGGTGAKPQQAMWKTVLLRSKNAEVLAKTVVHVFGKQAPELTAMAKGNDQLLIYAPTAEVHDAVAALVVTLDKGPASAKPASAVIALRHAAATDMATTVSILRSKDKEVTATPEPFTNQLVLHAPDAAVSEIRDLIEKLDRDVGVRKLNEEGK